MKGVLVMDNGNAPEGWVEIQRDDENPIYKTDFEAAQAARKRARMPTSVILLVAPAIGVSVDAELGYAKAVQDAVRESVPAQRRNDRWVVCIHERVAKRARL